MATDLLTPPDAGELDLRIQAAGDGSTEAMGAILQGCRQYLLAVANHAMGPAPLRKAGASDAVQETFLERSGISPTSGDGRGPSCWPGCDESWSAG